MTTSFPRAAKPAITWNHIDGPLLTCRNGRLHWLTLWDRFQLWSGMATIETLERRVLQS